MKVKVKPFVITGCARSATGYVAKLLAALGIHCGHEKAFNLNRHGLFRHEGDSSWLAAPWLSCLVDEVVVFHQTRHPVSQIRSAVRTRIRYPYPRIRYERFMVQHCSALPMNMGVLDFYKTYWYYWNQLIEESGRVTKRYRIEDMGVELLQSILDLIGVTLDERVLQKALTSVPTNYNTRPRVTRESDTSITWGTLPLTVTTMGRKYGYEDRIDIR